MGPGLHLHVAVVVQDDDVCFLLSEYFSVERTVLAFLAGLLVQVEFQHELVASHHSLQLGPDFLRPSAVSVIDYLLGLDGTSDPPVLDSGSFYCYQNLTVLVQYFFNLSWLVYLRIKVLLDLCVSTFRIVRNYHKLPLK